MAPAWSGHCPSRILDRLPAQQPIRKRRRRSNDILSQSVPSRRPDRHRWVCPSRLVSRTLSSRESPSLLQRSNKNVRRGNTRVAPLTASSSSVGHVVGHVDGALSERPQGHDVEGALMGGREAPPGRRSLRVWAKKPVHLRRRPRGRGSGIGRRPRHNYLPRQGSVGDDPAKSGRRGFATSPGFCASGVGLACPGVLGGGVSRVSGFVAVCRRWCACPDPSFGALNSWLTSSWRWPSLRAFLLGVVGRRRWLWRRLLLGRTALGRDSSASALRRPALWDCSAALLRMFPASTRRCLGAFVARHPCDCGDEQNCHDRDDDDQNDGVGSHVRSSDSLSMVDGSQSPELGCGCFQLGRGDRPPLPIHSRQRSGDHDRALRGSSGVFHPRGTELCQRGHDRMTVSPDH